MTANLAANLELRSGKYQKGLSRISSAEAYPSRGIPPLATSLSRIAATSAKPDRTSFVSLLQVGEGCVGKTTLVKNLFAAYCRESDPAIQDGPRTVQDFADSPEASCTDIEVQVQPEDSETVTSFHYCIQARFSISAPLHFSMTGVTQ